MPYFRWATCCLVAMAAVCPAAAMAHPVADVLNQDNFTIEHDTYALGETVKATIVLRNTTQNPIRVARADISSRASGVPHNQCVLNVNCKHFSPTLLNFTLRPGEQRRLDASMSLGATARLGLWDVYPTYNDNEGRDDGWHDGPSKFIRVVATPAEKPVVTPPPVVEPPPVVAPPSVVPPPLVVGTALTTVTPLVDRDSFFAGETVRASVLFQNDTASPVAIGGATIAARPPNGPAQPFNTGLPAQTIPVGAGVQLTAALSLPPGARAGAWRIYGVYQDALGEHEGPATFIGVAPPRPTPAPPKADPRNPPASRATKGPLVIPFAQGYDVGGLPRARVCPGVVVKLTLKDKRRTLTRRRTKLDRRCRYRTTFRVSRARVRSAKKLTVVVSLRGNRFIGSTTNRWTVRVPR